MIGNISKSKGFKGDPGNTPVRGVHYWTEDDKAEVINEVKDMKKSDWNQNDEFADGFIKNRTHYIDKNLYITDNGTYFFNKGTTNWSCNYDIPYSYDLKEGCSYEVKTLNMGSIVFTPTKKEYNESGSFIYAYSEDGKVSFSLTGVYVDTEDDAEFHGKPIGTFCGMGGQIYYESESLDEPFGGGFDEKFEEVGGWDEYGYFYVEGAVDIYECTPVPLDDKFIPDTVERVKNKINSWDDFTGEMTGNEEYPTINMMMQEKESAVNDAVSSSNAYADIKIGQVEERVNSSETIALDALDGVSAIHGEVDNLAIQIGQVEERVTTNEQSIAGAFTYCGEVDAKITQVENDVTSNKDVIDSNVDRIIALENKTAELETDMGDVETALDNIITIQNNLIGGESV